MRCTPRCATRSPACARTRRRACCCMTGAGRGFCAGQDLSDRAVSAGDAPVDLGASIERNYKPLVLGAALAADAGDLRGERRRGRRGRQSRVRVRHRDRREVGELHRSVQQARADSRYRRHLLPAAPRRHRPRDGDGDAGRQDQRRAGGGMGSHLAMRRRRRAAGGRGQARHRILRRRRRAVLRARSRRSTRARPTRSKRSSTSSAICMRELGASDDYREGVAAFMAKRPPKFTGR